MNRETADTVTWWVEPLGQEAARDILSWRYEPPYDFYDPPADADEDRLVAEFLRPDLGFHAVYGALPGAPPRDTRFIGFCSFGIDGQVPGGDYSAPALDIGLGMRPELTGQGLGALFFGAILDFAMRNRPANRYRLTVANFNERAIALYHQFGFVRSDQFLEHRTSVAYSILVRQG